MPLLVRWMIKAALAYFVLALLAGLVEVAGGPLGLSLPGTHAVFLHLLVVGWITQLIIGVATWMFPKFSKDRPRGDERLGWATFALLNAGLLLRAAGEPLLGDALQGAARWAVAVSAGMQLAAGWLFVINMWPRVKER